MNEQHFNEHLDRFGPDIGSWPGELVESAEQLLRRSAAAQQAHGDAVNLHALFTQNSESVRAPDALRTQILANIAASASPTTADQTADIIAQILLWLRSALWRPVVITAALCVLGFILGMVDVRTQSDQDNLSLLVFNERFEELIDE